MRKHLYLTILSILFCLLSNSVSAQIQNKVSKEKNGQDAVKTTVEKSLKKKTSWSLQYSSMGCFHNESENIELNFEKGKVFALRIVKNKFKQKIKLDQSQQNSFILFEKKLNSLNNLNAGCTTTDTYVINSKDKTYSIRDSSCSWNGYSKLKQELGLN